RPPPATRLARAPNSRRPSPEPRCQPRRFVRFHLRRPRDLIDTCTDAAPAARGLVERRQEPPARLVFKARARGCGEAPHFNSPLPSRRLIVMVAPCVATLIRAGGTGGAASR